MPKPQTLPALDASDPPPPPATTAEAAAAYVLGRALEEPATGTAALGTLRQRIEALADPTSPAALDELRRHLPVLEALFQRFAVEALNTRRADDRARLLRASLQAQQAHARTFALLRALSVPARRAELHPDTEGDLDPHPDA